MQHNTKTINEYLAINEELSRDEFCDIYLACALDLLLHKEKVAKIIDVEGAVKEFGLDDLKGKDKKTISQALKNTPEFKERIAKKLVDYFSTSNDLDDTDKTKLRRLFYKLINTKFNEKF